MRVISGTAKGLLLKSVAGRGTRPTTDKVKEALFNMIGPYFSGDKVLDLFAGTGGLGIEALSRGAGQAIFIDRNPKAIEVIKHNIQTTNVMDRSEVYCSDAKRALKVMTKQGLSFKLIFLDPPYRLDNADVLLADMWNNGLIAKDAIIIVEHDSKYKYPNKIQSLYAWKTAGYGEVGIIVYRVNELEI